VRCSHIYTNPAEVCEQRGLLVRPHHAHTCRDCPVNMCKGRLLQQHLAQHHASAAASTRVAYIGDGSNDLCAARTLRPQDVVFARAGFALDRLLADQQHWEEPEQQQGGQQQQQQQGGQQQPNRRRVAATVVRWASGHDVLAWLRDNAGGSDAVGGVVQQPDG
jgi:hypothetical protein